MMKRRYKKGTTLVEITLYFSLLSLMMGAVMSFAVMVIDMSRKSDNLHETQANLEFITRTIVMAVQTAKDIDEVNSVFDDDGGVLSLVVDDAAKNPTRYYVQDNNLYAKFGADVPVQLNSDSIACSVLHFKKAVQSNIPDQININAVFEADNNDMAGMDSLLQINTTASLRI